MGYDYIGASWLDDGSISTSGVSGETFAANCAAGDSVGDACYVTGVVGGVIQVVGFDILDIASLPPAGVIESKSTANDCIVRMSGISTANSGLTAGVTYYVDTDSSLTDTVPAPPPAALSLLQTIGHSISTTQLLVQVGSWPIILQG